MNRMKHLLAAVVWGSLFVLTWPFAKLYDALEKARNKLK